MVVSWRTLADQHGLLDKHHPCNVAEVSSFFLTLHHPSRKGEKSNSIGYFGCFRWGAEPISPADAAHLSPGSVGVTDVFGMSGGIGNLLIRRIFGESSPKLPCAFLLEQRMTRKGR